MCFPCYLNLEVLVFSGTFDILNEPGWSTQQVSQPEAYGISEPQSPCGHSLSEYEGCRGFWYLVLELVGCLGQNRVVRDFLWGVLSLSCVGKNWDGLACGCLRMSLAEGRGPGLGYCLPAWPLSSFLLDSLDSFLCASQGEQKSH